MKELIVQPELVGRENELKLLQRHLRNALNGLGSALFISGEAGVGKTRLISELLKDAEKSGFKILKSQCLPESRISYRSVIDALKGVDLEYLFSDEAPPRVEHVYVVHNKTSILLGQASRKDSDLNPEIFSSMLNAVSSFVEESLDMLDKERKKDRMLSRLESGEYTILIERGALTHLVTIISGRENEFLKDDMRSALTKVQKEYGERLEDWSGNVEDIAGIERHLEHFIRSRKYDGVDYEKEDEKKRRDRLFESISRGLIRESKEQPLLLVIDDMQWIDPSSLALIHYVVRNARDSPLLVLGAYRPEELIREVRHIQHPLVKTMRLMNREDLLSKIELRRLDRESTFKVVGSCLGKHGLEEKVLTQIYEETEGNPFFLIEVLKLLADDEVIVKENGMWIFRETPAKVSIPHKVFDVISQRLDKLQEDQKEILQMASVVGEKFSSRLIGCALHMDKVKLLKRLDAIEKVHMLIHSLEEKYFFDHSKVREVLYEEISPELRKELHGIVAECLERYHGENVEKVAADLAYHYYHSPNMEKAAKYLCAAGNRALKQYSNVEAAEFLEDCMGLVERYKIREHRLPYIVDRLQKAYSRMGESDKLLSLLSKTVSKHEHELDNGTRARFYRYMGNELLLRERTGDAMGCFDRGLELLERDGKEKCEIEQGLGLAYFGPGNYEDAISHWNKALEIAEDIGDEKSIATSAQLLATGYWYTFDFESTLELRKKSLERWEKLKIPSKWAILSAEMGLTFLTMGNADGAVEYFEQAEGLGELLDYTEDAGELYRLLGIGFRQLGLIEKAEEFFERQLLVAEKLGLEGMTASSLENLGMALYSQGKTREGIEMLLRAGRLYKRSGGVLRLGIVYGQLASVYRQLKNAEEARRYNRLSREELEKTGNPHQLYHHYLEEGNISLLEERWDDAVENFEESLSLALDFRRDGLTGEDQLLGLARAYLGKGDNERADEYLKTLEDLELKLHKDLGPSYFMTRGLMHLGEERFDMALEAFKKSVELYDLMNIPGELAEGLIYLGRAFEAAGNPEKAVLSLEIAARLSEEAQREALLEKAKAELERIGREREEKESGG